MTETNRFARLHGAWKTAAAAGVAALGLAGALVTAGTATGAAATTLPIETGTIPAGVKLSGVIDHGPASDTAAFSTWRGAPVQVVTDYLGGNNWAALANTTWASGRWQGTKYHFVWSMFMLPTDGSGNLATGATGAYNSYFTKAAQGLVAGGLGYSTIRLGWENTGSWYPWSLPKNPAAFAAYWRQIVTTMRAVPGAHFTFDFNISDQAIDPSAGWPGDAYVDYVGGDFYDQSWASSYAPTDHAKVWSHILTQPYGLNWLTTFAAAHHKRLSLPEWAMAYRCDGHGGGDDPYFLQAVHDWVSSHDVAYETYFNDQDDSCHAFAFTSGHFPNGSNTYRSVFNKPYAIGTTPTPAPSAPTDPTSGLTVSAAANRIGAYALSGATLSGSASIWDAAPAGTTKVVFSLDGTVVHTEGSAPFDYVGTGAGDTSLPLSLATLAKGSHTITATETSASGTKTVSSTFTVA